MIGHRLRFGSLVAFMGIALLAAPPAAQATVGYLTGPSQADPLEIAISFMQENHAALGLTAEDVSEWVVTNHFVTKHNGVTHVYFQQQLAGIGVHAGILNVNVSSDGRVFNPGSRFVPNLADSVNALVPRITAEMAVRSAADSLGLVAPEAISPVQSIGGPSQAVVFSGAGLSMRDIPVKLVLLPVGTSDVRLAWDVQIEPDDQHYWQVQVDAISGRTLKKTNHVLSDSYKVFEWPAESPIHVRPPNPLPPGDGRTVVTEAAADPTASPFGWHDLDGLPVADTVTTEGNNVFAHADQLAIDAPNPPPPVSLTRDFIFPHDAADEPPIYLDAAVTNLFYWNNVIHDIHYLYGFDEASGNFQFNNYGRGGIGNDELRAEAQDGSGTNNANMLTLGEGIPPRMQMFIWSAPSTLTVNSPFQATYPAGSAGFGPNLKEIGPQTNDVVLVDDGQGESTSDACEDPPWTSDVSGKFCLIDRGTCEFGSKILNCEDAGGVGAIIVNNQGDAVVTMGPGTEGGQVTIPSVFIGQSNGQQIKDALATDPVNVTMATAGVDRDSDLDNGVILHEYGHGVSNRLTGGPGAESTPLCLSGQQQAGEGWSDWHALALTQRATRSDGVTPADGTEPRGIGNYVTFQEPDGPGIRPFPYSTDLSVNPQTYGDLTTGTLSVPHGVGTVWATATWEMFWALVNGVPELGLAGHGFREDVYNLTPPLAGNQLALQLVMDGMKLQPCSPNMLDARDAILAADLANNDGANQCHIWSAFAKRGMGVNALSQGTTLNVTEDFQLPAECVPGPCIIPPKFAGIDTITTATDGSCKITLTWSAAEDNCDTGSISYSVYRSTDPEFLPDDESRIAAGLTGLSYEDSDVESGVRYHYVVRATDGLGNTDQNLVRKSERPVGQLSDPGQTHFDDAGDTTPETFFPSAGSTWAVRASDGVGDSRVYASTAAGNYPHASCVTLESDTIYLGSNPTLSFESKWDIESLFDGGIIEVSTQAGGFADWRKLDTIVYPSIMGGPLVDTACTNEGLRDGEPAFNGTSAGLYVPFTGSLFEYANQPVRIRFVLGSDPAVNDLGWFVDNITIDDVRQPGDCNPAVCPEIDDSDPAVEYRLGWHRRQDDRASGGGYHRRMGSPGGGSGPSPTARVVFEGDEVTYFYVKSDIGGTADISIDGSFVETLSYGANLSGEENPTFGHERTYSGLGAGSHELLIEHRTGAVYVDGFGFACEPGAGADASAAEFGSHTQTDSASATEGPVISRTIEVDANDVHLSVVVEGSLEPLSVSLLDPDGGLIASGEALLAGSSVSGLDASVSRDGTYTIEILNATGAFETLEISTAHTFRRD